MPTTARQIVRGALRLLGTHASGEPVPASEAFDGLEALNAFLDSASNERLTAYVIERLNVPLVAGKAVYSWGTPGGDIAHPRPFRLEAAVLQLPTQDYEYPIAVVDQPTYASVALKTQESLYPSLVYYEPTYPLGVLHVWTVPQMTLTLGLFPWVPLTTFSSLDTEVSFPAGYQRWLTAALAIELAPQYGVEPSPVVIATLAQAVSAIKRVNTSVPTLGMDPAYSGRQAGYWDATVGGYIIWRR